MVKQIKEADTLWKDLLSIKIDILLTLHDHHQKIRLNEIFEDKETEILRQDVIDLVSVLKTLNRENLAQEIESIHSRNKLVFNLSPLSSFNRERKIHLEPDHFGG